MYTIMRGIFAAFNVGFGGVAGFVKPVIFPMAVGAAEAKARGEEINEEYAEEIKGMCSAAENVGNFFCNVLFVGSAGALLVQRTLTELGYTVSLIDLAKVEIPIALLALTTAIIYFYLQDKKLYKKYYLGGK